MENALEEKYGKGLKMLKAMGGFKVGKGVGKSEQGIVNPVEAIHKKNNTCLGEGVFEEKNVEMMMPSESQKQIDPETASKKQEAKMREKLD